MFNVKKFADFRRLASMYLAGQKIAAMVKAAILPKVAVDLAAYLVVGGIGNTEGRQTDWTGRRTQARESARRMRRWDYFGPGAHFQGRGHAAKPPPGTAQPLPRTEIDRYLCITRMSDGSIIAERDLLEARGDYAKAGLIKFGQAKPPRVSNGAKDRANRYYSRNARTGAVLLLG